MENFVVGWQSHEPKLVLNSLKTDLFSFFFLRKWGIYLSSGRVFCKSSSFAQKVQSLLLYQIQNFWSNHFLQLDNWSSMRFPLFSICSFLLPQVGYFRVRQSPQFCPKLVNTSRMCGEGSRYLLANYAKYLEYHMRINFCYQQVVADLWQWLREMRSPLQV